jgi:AcrR family transcriptional regulator
MITQMQKRKYTLRKRADHQDETRARIVEATMALHEELGPRNATISAIAQRAGVQRLTVYRHFPDEFALFRACTSCWLERNPPPMPVGANGHAPTPERGREGLAALYRYYRETRGMLGASYRDVAHVPALQGPMQELEEYVAAYRDALLACWTAPPSRQSDLRATMVLVVRFASWEVLADEGLDDDAIAALAQRWVQAAANGS